MAAALLEAAAAAACLLALLVPGAVIALVGTALWSQLAGRR